MESTQKMRIINCGDKNLAMPEINIIATLPMHLREMVEVMRPEDRNEILAFGISPEKALWRSYKSSIVRRTAYIDGKIAAIWGVSGAFMGEIGQPWLLTSDQVKKISPLRFTRIYQKEVKEMFKVFPKLANIVDSSYTSAIRLLEIVGFKVSAPESFGKHGALYRKFERVK